MNIAFLKDIPKEKLQKVVIVCIMTLAAIVGVMEFYVLKNWSALAEARSGIAKLKEQILQAERETRDSQQNPAHRAEVTSFVEAQRAAMISGDPFAWVVREISLLAQGRRVHVTALRPDPRAATSGASKDPTYTAGIDLSGTYDDIGIFVRDLENKFPAGCVESLSLSGGADDKGRHGALLNIALRVQPAEPAKKSEPKKSA